ncbi:hypothetical protein HFTV1-gp66 [Haloferax tailed virus 1]|uniref:Uncharacterized protein n=1 Tax=Haloferax tailed virus 1 TaxID=2507575 RepID=A0A410N6V8_HFTV1|nr:hypothetical protein M1M17_gp66 [Haloferax tailed virus 1]QAS68899.1 hypothetical protein HFTV1-gp66 [Haloferax tailed virus 1]
MTWKDDYQDEKAESGLTWDDFHQRRFVHVDELDDATQTLAELTENVSALMTEWKETRRELHEIKVLLKSEEFDYE